MTRLQTDYTANARRLASQAKTPYEQQQGASLLSLAQKTQAMVDSRRRASYNGTVNPGSAGTRRNPSGHPDDAANWAIVDGMTRDVDRMAADGTRLSTTQGDNPEAAKLNLKALAERRAMSQYGYNPMAGLGGSGVMRRGVFTPMPAMSLGGETLGDRLAAQAQSQRAASQAGQVARNARYDEWAAAQGAPEAVAERLAGMRRRYGDGQPVGREGAIMARTDLDDDEKLEFLIRARANRAQPTRDERMARKADREARYGAMRQEQMAARMAPMQQAMMMQMMNQNPDLAVRLLDLQQRGQATAAQMGLAQQRLGLDRELGLGELGMGQARLDMDGRRLDAETDYRNSALGLDRDRLAFERNRMDVEGDRFERQLDLDQRVADAGITARTEQNAIAKTEAEGRVAAAQEANRLKGQEIEALSDRGYSEQEMAMVSELAGALQQEGLPSTDAFNEAWRRVEGMRTGQAPAAPVAAPMQAGAADPIQAQTRVQAAESNPNSQLNRTFQVLGIAENPTALDISEQLLSRSKKKGSPVTEESLGTLRQYLLDRQSVDPEFMDLGNPLFAPTMASRHESYAMAEMLADPSVPLSEILDYERVKERSRLRAENAKRSIKRPGWREVLQ